MRRSLSDPLLRVTPAMWLLACAGDPGTKAPSPTSEPPTEPPTEPTECASTAPDGADGWSEAELEAFYTTEVHPLLVRELADGGCADCHVPGSTHAVVIWSDDPTRTFQSFWSAGRLDVDAARGLVAVVAPDAPTRMPLGGPAWSDEERRAVEQLACAIEQSGQEPTPACSDPVDPGHTPLRRLANWQYGQTVAATTGHAAAVADTLAPDDLAHGFDAVGAAQSFAPTHLERYLGAAETVAAETLDIPVPLDVFAEAELLSGFAYTGDPVEPSRGWGGPQDDGYWRFQRIRAWVDLPLLPVEHPGTYTVTVRARGHGGLDCVMDGSTCEVVDAHAMPELDVRVDGASVASVSWDSPFEEFGEWDTWSTTVALDAPATVSVGLGNASWGGTYQRDVELDVDWIHVTGPDAAELPAPDQDRLDRFLICDAGTASCAEDTVHNALDVLWRRPPTADEVARYRTLIDLVTADGGTFEDGVTLVLQAALASPHFVFRPEPDLSSTPAPLSAHAVAVRLSYMVWGAPPDATLRARAADGSLLDEAVLLDELDRLLADPRSAALADHFAAQWWQLSELEALTFTAEADPDFDEPLRAAMAEELRLLFRSALTDDASLVDLLERDTTWVNDRLAAHYALPLPGTGDTFVEVDTTAHPRGGLLQSGAFLALTSHPSKTSPTRRGKWLLQQMLCQPPADPPDSVETDVADPEEGESTSLREQLEAHRTDPACAACHATMDPLGLSFEHFGPTGRWRDIDDYGAPVDPSASLPTGETLADHVDAIAWIAGEPAHTACITQNFAVYALGRAPTALDPCAMDDIETAFDASGHTLRGLLRAVVTSPLFLEARTEGAD